MKKRFTIAICVAFGSIFQGCAARPQHPNPPKMPPSIPDPIPERCNLKGLTLPKALKPPNVAVSPELKQRGIQGKAMLRLLIDEAGIVRAARVIKGLHPKLDVAVVAATKKMKFSPALKDCTPIPMRISYQFNFTLEKTKQR